MHDNRWIEENREAIEQINQFIDRHGLLASRLRIRPTAGDFETPSPARLRQERGKERRDLG
jgi:hypothetical protein